MEFGLFSSRKMNQMYNFLLTILFLYISTAESADPSAYFCNDNSKTNNSTQLSRNIDSLLPKLVQGAIQKGFLATSYGNGANQIYGLAQCRADVSRSDCSACIKDAAEQSQKLCRPNQPDVRIWYDYCFLKYNSVEFFGQVDTSPSVIFYNVANVTDPNVFNEKLESLVDKIESEAVKLPGSKGLGKAETEVSAFQTLYGLVQCTRDLSPINCAQCFAIAIENFATFCNDKKGCRVLYGSCYVRYELYPFFFPLDSQGSLVANSANYESFKVFKP